MKPGESWLALVHHHGTPEFSAAFAPNAILEASVLENALRGSDSIGAYFAATTGMFDSIEFVDETRDQNRTYLEWTGRFQGQFVGGATIVHRQDDGLIKSVWIYHRPLSVVQQFANDVGRRLRAGAFEVKHSATSDGGTK